MTSFDQRKLKKRLIKYANIVFKDHGIQSSSDPTRHIMACNVGLLTRTDEAHLIEYFSKFGQVEEICMAPGKSYSFVSFNSIDEAKTCYSTEHHDVTSLNISGPLYLMYVERVPKRDSYFENYDSLPPGLFLVHDFISKEEELLLAQKLDVSNSDNEKTMKHRRVKHYGYEFKYGLNNVDKDSPLSDGIPEELDFLPERISDRGLGDIIKWVPDQLTINSYLPGQGIPPHVDTHSAFKDPILSLSLLSDVVMEFEKCDKTSKASVLLPQRSLLIMSGEARYYWTHGITPRKTDIYKGPKGLCVKRREHRISYTFRKILRSECNCSYKTVCDSFLKKNIKSPSNEAGSKIEDEYVHKVYEKISDHFSLTRHSPWPRVHDFIKSVQPGSILLDVGCGNGKYFGLNKMIFHFGGDSCYNLNLICKDRGEVVTFNCLSLPFGDCIADAVICIAVLHHLSSEERRLKALTEILRVLRPGGKALIYVWAKDQQSTNYLSKNETVENEVSSDFNSVVFINDNDVLPIHENRTPFKHDDLLVPWNIRLKNQEQSCHLRYYHVFKDKELDNMCTQIGAEIIDSYYDDGNWCVEFQKPRTVTVNRT